MNADLGTCSPDAARRQFSGHIGAGYRPPEVRRNLDGIRPDGEWAITWDAESSW